MAEPVPIEQLRVMHTRALANMDEAAIAWLEVRVRGEDTRAAHLHWRELEDEVRRLERRIRRRTKSKR